MMNPIVEETVHSTDSHLYEGSFLLGPPILPTELEGRDRPAGGSPSAFAWSGQRSPRVSQDSRRPSLEQLKAASTELSRRRSDESMAETMSIPSPPFAQPLLLTSFFPGPPSSSPGPSTPRRTLSYSPPPSPGSTHSTPSTFTQRRGIRSQVSLDAIPLINPVGDTASSSSYSSRSASPASPSYEFPRPISRRAERPRPLRPNSVIPLSPPSHLADDVEGKQPAPVNASLRSAPGVIGLGEGWAGGPQGKKKRRWFRRRRTEGRDPDPLALWAIEEGNEPASPMKAMWNRSKVRIFGASTSALNEGEKRRSFFSRSRLNVSEFGRSRLNLSDEKPAKRPNLSNLFSRSQANLSKRGVIPASPSLPSFVPTRAPRTTLGMSRETAARSDPHLVPRRSGSLRNQPLVTRPGGPAPPRRPQSFGVNGNIQTPQIPELDERQASISSTSLDTPDTADSTPPLARSGTTGITLLRTGTFGADHEAEQHLARNKDVVGLDTLRSWAEETPKVRPSLIATPTPSSSTLRKQSVLLRLKTAFSPTSSPQRSRPPTTLQLETLQSRNPAVRQRVAPFPSPPVQDTHPRPSQIVTRGVAHEPLGMPAPTRPDMQTRRRGSWLGSLSTDAWAKRLSRLPEGDEEDVVDSERRASFFERVLPNRSSSLHHLHSSFRPKMTASMSLPALHGSQVTLPLELGEYGRESLEIDDILDNARRRDIIDTFDLQTTAPRSDPPGRSDALEALSGRKGHTRCFSEPFEVTGARMEGGHRRNQSVPYTDLPRLEQQLSGSEASTTNPVTPVQPSFTYPSRPPLTAGSSASTFRTDASYHSAFEELDTSSGSSNSVFEEASTVEQAVRVSTPGENRVKASYISLTDLRRSPPVSPSLSSTTSGFTFD